MPILYGSANASHVDSLIQANDSNANPLRVEPTEVGQLR
jgi:hypothetical protein